MISVGREFRTSAVCSVPPQGCEDVGAGQQWPLGRAVAVWKIHCSRENTRQSQGMKLGWLLRPLGSMAMLHGDMGMPASHS